MTRRFTAISAALVLALIGTMLVVVYVGRADARALQGIETVEVLVATGPVTKGTSVEQAQAKDLLATERLPRKTVPLDALAELKPTDSTLVFATDMTAGEILRRPRLVAAETVQDGLRIPDEMLAVTVRLEDPARVGGFVKVGSHIAIFDSYNVMEGNRAGSWTPSGDHLQDEFPKNKATRLLLPKVQVLAIGTTTTPERRDASDSDDSSSAVAPSTAADTLQTLITVAVSQRDAERLIHGVQTGTLYLGLLGSFEPKPGPGVDNRSLFNK